MTMNSFIVFSDIFSIILIPVVLAIFSYCNPRVDFTRKLMAVAYWLELAVVYIVVSPVLTGKSEQIFVNENFRIDRLAGAFIVITTFVFAVVLSHANYLFAHSESEEHALSRGARLKTFYFCVNLFYLAMCSIFIANNLGYLWMSVEATTLASAPLVYFERTKNALEATWKYLIICSVGIALALLGTVFLFASSQQGNMTEGSLVITDLIAHAGKLNPAFLKIGFVLCLLGYGTKSGIFPLHSWLPDAHSEAPAAASALLSGALLNGALFAIWRITEIIQFSKQQPQIMMIILGMGALTVFAAALFLIRQHGFKRMWAYSSVENVGIMLVAIGLASPALFLLQAINHSLAKVALFLLSGNIVEAAGTKKLYSLHGVLKSCPTWGCLLALGTFAITGAPPFGTFLSKVFILTALVDKGNWLIASILICGTALAFVSISIHVGRVLLGNPRANFSSFAVLQTSMMPVLLLICSSILGIIVYPAFGSFLK